MKIIIHSLELTNFKGVAHIKIEPEGKNLEIRGANATGKTSLFDAWTFLLFGRDSLNSAAFGIKPVGSQGLDCSVEATITIDDQPLTLKRTQSEKWTKARGGVNSQTTGNTTAYERDGVPCSESEYKALINSIVADLMFKMLSDPRYFAATMPWLERRNTLLALGGDVSDTEVIADNPDLSELLKLMGSRTLDDFKAVSRAQRKKVNDELDEKPTRIDQINIEIQKILEEIPDPAILKTENSDLNYQISQLEYELGTIKNGNALGALKNKILTAEAAMAEHRTHYYSHQQADPNASRRDELQYQIANQSQTQQTHKIKLENQKLELADMDKRLAALRIEVAEMREQTWTGDLICVYCKAPFTEEKLEEMRREFNAQKAKQIDEKVTAGKALRAEFEAKKESIAELQSSIDLIASTIAKYKEELEQIKPENEVPTPFESSQAYPGLAQSIADSKKAYEELKSSTEPRETEINGILAVKRAELKSNSAQIIRCESVDGMNESISRLKDEERELAKEIEKIDKGIYLAGEFIKAKVRLMEMKIGGMFKIAQFRMFTKNITTDDINECCDVMFNNVPYADLNSAARIQVGADIISTLSRHYGIAVPVWFDNAESVCEIPEMDTQVIKLIVSKEDKKLRVEVAS